VTDGLADAMSDVILASLAATNKLFESAAAATHGATAMRNSARRTALRVCLVMGPLVDTWRMLPSHAQVAVASLMGHIAAAVVQLDPSQGSQAPGGDVDTAGLGGSLSAALAGVIAYLSSALQSLNPAVKLEAGRVLLRMSAASERMGRGEGDWVVGMLLSIISAQRLFLVTSHPTQSPNPLHPPPHHHHHQVAAFPLSPLCACQAAFLPLFQHQLLHPYSN